MKQKECDYRKLAQDGFGDDVIYDQAGSQWIFFRTDNVFVKSEGANYTEVKKGQDAI